MQGDMMELELKRNRLLAPDEVDPKGPLVTEMKAAMTAERITPKPAFRLLTLMLLIFALADRVSAMSVWWTAGGVVAALVLAGIVTARMGLDDVLCRVISKNRFHRSRPAHRGVAHDSATRWGTGSGQP
jgi:hypothetical protein